MQGLDAAAQAFISTFESLGIEYAIMGGLAVRLYALPRPTFDVDFTASITPLALAEVSRVVESLGFSVPAAQDAGWIDAVRDMPVVKFQWFIGERAIDVDIFLADTPFQHETLARRRRHDDEFLSGWFVSPEDLILLKLMADRLKDRTDVADILFIQAGLDEVYMRRWAEQLGVSTALESLLHDRQ